MNKWLVALTVIIPTFIEVVDTSVVNVSLDHIRGSLSAGVDEATWTITSYLVSNAIIIPISGWLGRVFGRKRYLMFSVVLFTVSSFFCGLAWSLPSLIVFRIFQGIGGGALQPISQSILLETFPVAKHGIAMAIFGVGIMFAPVVGPIMGGWITDNWSWRWIFYINIPIGILSVLLIYLNIKDPPYLERIKRRIDYWGLILIALGLGCLQIVLDKGQQDDWFNSAFIVRLSLVAIIALTIFVFVELRSKEPVVNLRIFKNIGFTAGNIIMFFSFFVLFGSIVLLPIFCQKMMGYTSFLAGLVLAPGGIATLFAMPLAGRFVTKINPKWILITGMLINAYSTVLLSNLSTSVDFHIIAWARIVMGAGMGFAFIVLTNLTLSSVRKEEMNNATGIYNLLRNLGGSFGVAFVTTMLARRAQFHQSRLSETLHPLSLKYQMALNKIMHSTGATKEAAQGIIYQDLLRQATMFSFNDTFFMCTLILLAIIPLTGFLKRIDYSSANISGH